MKFLGYFRDLTVSGKKLFSQLEPGNAEGVLLFTQEPGEDQLRIVAAANRYPGDIVVVSARHHDLLMNRQLHILKEAGVLSSTHTKEQGFVDNKGCWHNREDALKIAYAAGQLNLFRKKTDPVYKLFSEDLY